MNNNLAPSRTEKNWHSAIIVAEKNFMFVIFFHTKEEWIIAREPSGVPSQMSKVGCNQSEHLC